MWFKQVTCDCCYKPMPPIGRHNRYYAVRILEFSKVSPSEFQRRFSYFNNPNETRFNYDTSPYCYGGFVYCYKTDALTPNSWSTFYCGNECALKAATKMNAVLYYWDENEHSVAFITPQIKEINDAISESEYTPLLMMDWPEEYWFQNRNNYRDLHQYGFDSNYPTFRTNLCDIVKPNSLLLNDYKNLMLDPSFQKDFWGASNEATKNSVLEAIPNFLNHVDIDFGRRMMIEWFITSKSGQFIGFIHLTCMSPAFPYKWVVEFGLIKDYRRRGIMKTVLNGIVSWAKRNGCDKLYAISEDFNSAAHATLKSLPYPVKESRRAMADDKAGYRPMRVFTIDIN